MSEEKSKIIERIKKLIAFQKDAEKRNSQHELENATARIFQIMLKYKITEEEIDSMKKENDYHRFSFQWKVNKVESDWIINLLNGLQKYMFVKVVFSGIGKTIVKGSAWVLGTQADFEVFEYTANFVMEQIKQLGKEEWPKFEGVIHNNRNKFLRAFYRGAVYGLLSRLEEEFKLAQKQDTVEVTANQVTALIKISDAALKEAFQKEFPHVIHGGRNGHSLSDNLAMNAGYQRGKQIQIRKAVNE